MKTEFVTLSPVGICALILSGFLFAQGVGEPAMIGIGILALMVARENAREPFASGSYRRGWFVWRRVGPADETSGQNNIVPFKGPAA